MILSREATHHSLGESLISLNNNFSNLIVAGLIFAALKKTIGFEAKNTTDLLALHGSAELG